MNDYGYVELKKYLVEHNIKHSDLAEALSMPSATFSRKINRAGADFSLSEARAICQKYGLKMQDFFA